MLNTQKCSAFYHVLDAIQKVRGIECLHAGLYKSAHKHFKTKYGKLFKRASKAVVKVIQKNKSLHLSIRKAEKETIPSGLFSKRETLQKGTSHLVRGQMRVTLQEFEKALEEIL